MPTIPWTAEQLGPSEPSVGKACGHLQDVGILREIAARSRGKIFVYHDYLVLLNEGTEG